MGQCKTICHAGEEYNSVNLNPFTFEYGQDLHEPVIDHKDELKSSSSECEGILKKCQQGLRETGRLYKDPSINTEPIILRSYAGEDTELRCTFERPHVFLKDPSDPKGKSRQHKIVDVSDCSCSQITIRDEVMQPFGVLLCFLAEHPQIIRKVITTDSNSYGIHVIKMNVGARKELIYIDDYMLCSQKQPLFVQPIKGIYLWPCLLEKAWFKVKGYIDHRIQKNSPREIIKSFLSYPITTFVLKEGKEEYNRALMRDNLFNFDVDKGCIFSSRANPPHKIGLSGRKHFYLIKVLEYEKQKLFYLRNPCEMTEFRGQFNIIPEDLQALIKRETNDVKIHDNNFILDESEFLEQIDSFSMIEFNKNSQDLHQESITLSVNEENYVLMDLKNDSLVSMAFQQYNYRNNELPFLPLSFFVISLNDNSLVSDNDDPEIEYGTENSVFFKKVYKHLKGGQYLIRLKKRLGNLKYLKKYDKPDKIIVTTSGKVRFDYKQLNLMDRNFQDFLLERGQAQLRDKLSNSKADVTNLGVEYVDFWLGDLAVLYFEKKESKRKTVNVEVKFMKTENLECLTHVIGKDFKALDPISVNAVMIFEKVVLSKSANLGQFIMDTY